MSQCSWNPRSLAFWWKFYRKERPLKTASFASCCHCKTQQGLICKVLLVVTTMPKWCYKLRNHTYIVLVCRLQLYRLLGQGSWDLSSSVCPWRVTLCLGHWLHLVIQLFYHFLPTFILFVKACFVALRTSGIKPLLTDQLALNCPHLWAELYPGGWEGEQKLLRYHWVSISREGLFPCKPPPLKAAQGTHTTDTAQRRVGNEWDMLPRKTLFLLLGSSKLMQKPAQLIPWMIGAG